MFVILGRSCWNSLIVFIFEVTLGPTLGMGAFFIDFDLRGCVFGRLVVIVGARSSARTIVRCDRPISFQKFLRQESLIHQIQELRIVRRR